MPTGPSHWHEHWGGDGPAWDYLEKRGFHNNKGVIYHPDNKAPDLLDLAAISYLIQEWDWDWARSAEEPDDS